MEVPPSPDPESPGEQPLSLARTTAVMSVGTSLSRVTGFARLAVMAWAIGGAETKLPDTYNLANSLPNIVYQLVLGEILATIFVPVFVEYIKTRARDEAWRLASTILNSAFIIAGAFSLITILAAPWIIKIYTWRVADPIVRAQQEATGTFFMRIFMPQMIFYATGAVLTGLLNAHRKFAPPMFAPILNNLIVMATFVGFRIMHGPGSPDLATLTGAEKWLLAGGTTLGVVVFTSALWPYVRKLPGRYTFRALDWGHPAIRKVGSLAKYSFAYVIVNQIGLWVILAIANARSGGVSAYQSSFILYQLPYGIFAVSVMTVLVTSLSEHNLRGDKPAMRQDISLGLRTTAFVIVPAAAGFVALSHPLIRLLLERGAFTPRSTQLYADTFAYMAVGLPAYAAFQQILRAFYAQQDTKTPLVVNSWAVVITSAFAIPLYRALGVPGLGLAHTIGYLWAVAHGGVLLRRRLEGIDGRRLLSSHARIGVASAVTALVAWVVARALEPAPGALAGSAVQVGAAVGAGIVLYAGLAAAFRMDEFRPVWRLVSAPFRRAGGTS
jgi:putative peptidoglycan lipid II flippase